MAKRPRWSIHNDLSGIEHIDFGEDWQESGLPFRHTTESVPRRLYINTPWGSLICGTRTQAWFPWKVTNKWMRDGTRKSHYSDWIWLPIVWHPMSKDRRRELEDEYERLDI